MKALPLLIALLAGLSLAPAAASAACARPDPALLRATWQAFRAATLAGQPQAVARFYRFPLKLLSPYDGDPPRKLNRAVFLSHYDELFKEAPGGGDGELLTQMKKSSGAEYIGEPPFDDKRCAYAVATRIDDYYFVYDGKSGWQVESLHHPYWDLYDALVR